MGEVATIPLFGVIGDAGSFVSFFFCHGFHRFLRERALVHYDLFAISRVLPTVPRMRLSCILCTWFPLKRSENSQRIMGDVGRFVRLFTFLSQAGIIGA